MTIVFEGNEYPAHAWQEGQAEYQQAGIGPRVQKQMEEDRMKLGGEASLKLGEVSFLCDFAILTGETFKTKETQKEYAVFSSFERKHRAKLK